MYVYNYLYTIYIHIYTYFRMYAYQNPESSFIKGNREYVSRTRYIFRLANVGILQGTLKMGDSPPNLPNILGW